MLSPATAKLDRGEKLAIYAQFEVRHAWLVDPLARTLEIFRLDGEGWRLVAVHSDDAVVRAEPFDAIELELDALWIDTGT